MVRGTRPGNQGNAGDRQRVKIAWPSGRTAAAAAVALILLYGALLRLEALAGRYGALPQPAALARVEQRLVPVARAVRPEAPVWTPVANPYVGGDPINYLRFAREMLHFYQAHVREPVFLALTRGMLWLTGDSDIAVSLASGLAGTLAILATYLLGAAAFSRPVGVGAALALAIEFDAIAWSVDGWRDDTFMLFVALTAWAFMRLLQHPTLFRAAVAGVVAGGACLTRVTALSFILPALAWIVVDCPAGGRRSLARAAATAALVTGVLLAPFLINCARVTGDPFFAINYHTRYYRSAEGLPADPDVSAFDYLRSKLAARPITTVDTAAVGVVVFPFTSKWSGFWPWGPTLGSILKLLSAAGLVLSLWSRRGRLLLVILLTSLVPYAITWPLGGGSEWRFTQHVYPMYLVAAFAAVAAALRGLAAVIRDPRDWRGRLPTSRIRQAAVAVAVLVAGAAAYYVAPYFVVRETVAAGAPANIGGGERDAVFFRGRWSAPYGWGHVIVRAALDDRVALRIPLPERRDYWLTLRMDPAETADVAYTPSVTVFVDRRTIGQIHFKRDPQRVGAYRFLIPKELGGRLGSRLDLVASHTVPAVEAGPRFSDIDPGARVAFYLWYVRVEGI